MQHDEAVVFQLIEPSGCGGPDLPFGLLMGEIGAVPPIWHAPLQGDIEAPCTVRERLPRAAVECRDQERYERGRRFLPLRLLSRALALAKVGVEGSNPFARSNFLPSAGKANGPSMGPLSNLNGSAAYQGQDG